VKAKIITKLILTNAAIIAADSGAILALNSLNPDFVTNFHPVVKALCYTVLIMSVCFFFALNYSYLKALFQKTEYVIDFANESEENFYRRELRNFIELTPPLFTPQINAALTQMDSIDQKRENLIEILSRNKSDCPDLLQTCDETDGIITQNIRAVLNRLTIVRGIDPISPQSKELYTKHAEVIDKALQKNYSILASFDDFLTYAAGMKDKIIEEDIGLKASITALKQLY